MKEYNLLAAGFVTGLILALVVILGVALMLPYIPAANIPATATAMSPATPQVRATLAPYEMLGGCMTLAEGNTQFSDFKAPVLVLKGAVIENEILEQNTVFANGVSLKSGTICVVTSNGFLEEDKVDRHLQLYGWVLEGEIIYR